MVAFSLLCSSVLPLAALAMPAQTPEKRLAIMDNDWCTACFVPYLVALAGDMEILGLASGTGDTWQHQSSLHAVATLDLGNLSECIPVYAGATWPLINTPELFSAWQAIHGKVPWGGAFQPENKTAEAEGSDPRSGDDPDRVVRAAFQEGFPTSKTNDSTNAANFMVEMVHKYPGQVSIYAAGSLTNVALATRIDSKFASLAKELVIMGGYVDVNLLEVTGSIKTADVNNDINLMIDPEAAKIALTADFPSITVTGNVANQVLATEEFIDEVYEVKNPYTEIFKNQYEPNFPFWDETAAALMVDPCIALNQTSLYLDVDTAYGSPSYGNIHVYQKELAPPNVRKVNYVHEIDGMKLKNMIKNALQHPKTCADMQ